LSATNGAEIPGAGSARAALFDRRDHARHGRGLNAIGAERLEAPVLPFLAGSFLIDRIGAEGVVDQVFVVVLLDLRRRLMEEYCDAPAAMMLFDRAVAVYQDFIRISGWTGNTSMNSSGGIGRAPGSGIVTAKFVA